MHIKKYSVFVFLGAVLAVIALLHDGDRAVEVAGLTRSSDAPAVEAVVLDPRNGIDRYREGILRRPKTTSNYVALAALHLREVDAGASEPQLMPKIVELVDKALELDPENVDARSLRVKILNKLHRFREAREEAKALLVGNPYSSFLHSALVDAEVELGHYEAAVKVSDDAIRLKPGLSAYARAAYLRQLHGDHDGATSAMALAASAGRWGTLDRAWALNQLAHLYLSGDDVDRAEQIFHGILQERPGYTDAVAGLAQCALAREHFAEGLRLIDQAMSVSNKVHYLETKLEILRSTGDTKAAEAVRGAILEAFSDAREIGENVDMELADFMLDNGLDVHAALKLADENRRRRPDHLHAAETYAWALHAAGRSGEAVYWIERSMRLGTGDAMVLYRAAHIYQDAGMRERAKFYFKAALDAHLHVESPSAAITARGLV